MAVLAAQNFDAIPQGDPVTTTAIGGAPWSSWFTNTTPTAQSGSAAHGARGVRVLAANGPCRIAWDEAAETTATRVHSYYFRLDNTVSANVMLGEIAAADATTLGGWRINPDLTVTIRDGTVATGGGPSVVALQQGLFYRSEWMTSTTGQELRIYEGESTVPIITLNGALTNNNHLTLTAGITAQPNGQSLSFDTVRIGDTWVGPAGTPAEPLPTPANFSFNASTTPGVVSIVVLWDAVSGASGYQIEVQQLVGGTWQEFNTFPGTGTSRTLTQADNGLVQGRTYRGRIRAMP